jgi:hypothetical protein
MDDKICLVLLIGSRTDVYRPVFERAGFNVEHLASWSGDVFPFNPEVVVVHLPPQARAADVATRLRAQVRFAPLILVGLSPSPQFESERHAGRLSGFDDVLPGDVTPGGLLSRVQQLMTHRPPLAPCVTATKPAA